MSDKVSTCDDCKFWHRISDNNDRGYCYRYAPQPVIVAAKSPDIIHPITRAMDVACGDFLQRVGTPLVGAT